MPAKLATGHTRVCRRCGAPVSADAPLGQCPKCLLNVALGKSAIVPLYDDDESPSEPRAFGDYELLELVARGGMGLVYSARQVSLNRMVALKMISVGDLASATAVDRFRTEAEATARLEHPHIVPIYEVGVHEDQHYFTMRFLEGGTLTDAMAQRRFSPTEAAALISTVARAVHHAHRFGILHRDIKPGNILFDSTGEPFVADFSLAKFLGAESGMTRSSAALGTPSYMSPEQITGRKQISTACDVYGLGAVLYQLLTGEPPFSAATPLETMRQALETEPARPRVRNDKVNRDLETICLKCLEKDPARRYGSAEELAEDLDAWREHRPLKARPVTTSERVFKWARRKPAVAGLIVALHLISVAGLAGILWQARRAREHARIATAEAERANIKAAEALEHSARAEDELWKAQLSEARVVRIAGGAGARVRGRELLEILVKRPDLTSAQRSALRQEAIDHLALPDIEHFANHLQPRRLGWNGAFDRYFMRGELNYLNLCEFPSGSIVARYKGPIEAESELAIMSPDERFVAASYMNGVVCVWESDRSEPIVQTSFPRFRWPKGPSFSDDSRSLLIVSDYGLDVYSVIPKSPPRRLIAGPGVKMARFAPNSKTIAAATAYNRTEIIEVSSGKVLSRIRTEFPPERLAWHPTGEFLAIGGDRGRLQIHPVPLEGEASAFKRVRTLAGHQAWVNWIGFSNDGDYLFSHGWDASSIVWDFRTGSPLIRDSRGNISGIHPAGATILMENDRDRVQWKATFHRPKGYLVLHNLLSEEREIFGLWISPNGKYAAIGYAGLLAHTEGTCTIWDVARGTSVGSVPGGWLEFSPNNRAVYSFERYGNKIYRYSLNESTGLDVSTRSLIYEAAPGEGVNAGKMMADGRTLVIAASRAIVLLDTKGERKPRKWNALAHVIEISNDNRLLAAMFHHEPAILWDFENQREITRTPKYSEIRFSPDDQYYSISTTREVQIRRIRDHELAFPAIPVSEELDRPDVRFSPDGTFFALISKRRFVQLFETATGKHLADLIPPKRDPNLWRLCFSPDGTWLAVTRGNGETIGWNLRELRSELAGLGLDWELSGSGPPM